ncbi:MAG: amidohydrolase family protein [Crocinitomicaceae bacterium]|nr:amidohydrolase family protein [Crocinitomicaceae bacterium]
MKKKILISCLLIFQLNQLLAQFGPENGVKKSTSSTILVRNARIYVSPKSILDNADILIVDGIIKEVGKNLKNNEALVHDYSGKTIVPSFVELYTDIGLPKLTATRPQLEKEKEGAYYWNEAIHPELNAASSFSIDAKANEALIQEGFGFSLSHFMDGMVRGTGALISLGKEDPNRQMLKGTAAQFMSFSKGSSHESYPSSQMGAIALMRQALYDLNFYSNSPQTEYSISLDAWSKQMKLPIFFKTEDKWEILRANRIANEFDLKFCYIGSGNEYAALDQIKKLNATLVIPMNFPDSYEVRDPYIARQIPLSDLKHWELAPSNPLMLYQNNIKFCLTSFGIKSAEQFWKNLRLVISKGLPVDAALAALTVNPANELGVFDQIGSIEKNKWASFSVYSSDPFTTEAQLIHAWLQGELIRVKEPVSSNIAGKYSVQIDGEKYQLEVEGTNDRPSGKIKLASFSNPSLNDTLTKKVSIQLVENDINLQFSSFQKNVPGIIQLHAKVSRNAAVFEGDGTTSKGEWVQWSAIRSDKETEPSKATEVKMDTSFIGNPWLPNMAFGLQSKPLTQTIVVKNATIWTNEADGVLKNAAVLIENGKIVKVAKNNALQIPSSAFVIDAKGMHLTAGIIDEHSHIAISKGVNEGGQSVTAEVSISDVVNPDDINIYRQLAGGVTAAQLLHGSANPIGGGSALIKLKWGASPEEMLIPNAPKFIKCALGENVKQSNWGDYSTTRFPQTRMGVEQVFYDAFYRAREYKLAWTAYNQKKKTLKPRRDLELDVLLEILESKRFVTCHSYVQSEINMLMHVADSMGFNINTFTHILEGYKVADKMKAHGVGGSTFSDWWAYKYEVNEAIPYNAKLMADQGVIVSINSDDAEMGRRLNQEAAKSIKYGGMSEEDALKMVTLNPAKLLHLDDRMGSIKVGKDADVVLWSDNPLSIQAKVQYTIVDGVVLYDASKNMELNARNEAERARIIAKMLLSNENGEKSTPFVKKPRKHYHCDTLGEEGETGENTH